MKVELKKNPSVFYQWRIVYAGTDDCVQRGGESLAYRYKGDAKAAIIEFNLKEVKKENDK